MKIALEPALTLLHEASHGTLATNSTQLPGYPYATVVPYVLDEAHCPVVCISALAEHTKNLLADHRASFSVLQEGAADVQDASRLTIVGDAERFDPSPEFLARYLRYEPKAEQLLALDFMFFRLVPNRVRFIGGVGRMGWLEGMEWDALPKLPAAAEAQFIEDASFKSNARIKLLGADCFGIDYEDENQRRRQRFPDAPLSLDRFPDWALRTAASLGLPPS